MEEVDFDDLLIILEKIQKLSPAEAKVYAAIMLYTILYYYLIELNAYIWVKDAPYGPNFTCLYPIHLTYLCLIFAEYLQPYLLFLTLHYFSFLFKSSFKVRVIV